MCIEAQDIWDAAQSILGWHSTMGPQVFERSQSWPLSFSWTWKNGRWHLKAEKINYVFLWFIHYKFMRRDIDIRSN